MDITISSQSQVNKCLNLYNRIDNEVQKYNSSCKQRCSACCHDYFYVSEIEFYTIMQFLLKDKDYNSTIDRLIKNAKEFCRDLKNELPEEYHKAFSMDTNRSIEYYLNPIGDSRISFSKPCIFLNNKNRCSIYEVRPIVCRLYGTIIDTRQPNNFRCEYATYNSNNDFSENSLSLEIDNINFNNGVFQKPKPFLYWFSEYVPFLKVGQYKKVIEKCTE